MSLDSRCDMKDWRWEMRKEARLSSRFCTNQLKGWSCNFLLNWVRLQEEQIRGETESLVWNVIYLDNQWKWYEADGVSRIHQRCPRAVNVGIVYAFLK